MVTASKPCMGEADIRELKNKLANYSSLWTLDSTENAYLNKKKVGNDEKETPISNTYACYTTTQAKKEKSTLGCNPCWSPPAAACSQSRNSVNWHITTNNSGFPWGSLSGLCRLCGEAYNHALLDKRNTSWEMDYLVFLVLCQHLNLASHMCVCVAHMNPFMLSLCNGNQVRD